MRRVEGERDWVAFDGVPRHVYRNDRGWISVLDVNFRDLLAATHVQDDQKHEVDAFIALRDGVAVGRVAVIVDRAYNERHGENTAFFGFYEAVDDDVVATELLNAAANWSRARGLSFLMGPLNPSMLHGAGMVIDGGMQPPLVGMPYNPDYYGAQMDACGMRKVKDLHSFSSDDPYGKVVNLEKKWASRKERSKLRIRSVDMAEFGRDSEDLRRIYNASFVDFWGFTPISRREFGALTASFKPILDPDLVLFATIDDEPVAFLMAIPDVNVALHKACRWNNGLFQTVSTLWNLKGPGRRRAIRRARVDMLATHPDCPDVAAPALLTFELLRRIRDKGYTSIEAAPLLENTSWWPSVRACLFTEPCRVYRIFGRAV